MSGMDRLTELLPCPFCGGEAYLSDAEAGTGGLSNRARNPRCWQCGVDLGYCDTAVEAAAAWNRRASQAAPAPSDGLREAVSESLGAVIGNDAYDCIRVWEAWSVGTMGEEDFNPVIERLDEITDAVMHAIAAPAPSDALREAVPAGLVEALRNGRQADMDGVMVTVSRQACEMAADILSALSASPAQEGGE